MDLKHPVIAYTAATNVEAIFIAEMLQANGIPAHAVEDQSGVSLWAAGTTSQFHQPNIWVDESTLPDAARLIQEFEEEKRRRDNAAGEAGEIAVTCEDCGHVSQFPQSLNGTTQECPHCNAYVDVGELPWEDDFGVPED